MCISLTFLLLYNLIFFLQTHPTSHDTTVQKEKTNSAEHREHSSRAKVIISKRAKVTSCIDFKFEANEKKCNYTKEIIIMTLNFGVYNTVHLLKTKKVQYQLKKLITQFALFRYIPSIKLEVFS